MCAKRTTSLGCTSCQSQSLAASRAHKEWLRNNTQRQRLSSSVRSPWYLVALTDGTQASAIRPMRTQRLIGVRQWGRRQAQRRCCPRPRPRPRAACPAWKARRPPCPAARAAQAEMRQRAMRVPGPAPGARLQCRSKACQCSGPLPPVQQALT